MAGRHKLLSLFERGPIRLGGLLLPSGESPARRSGRGNRLRVAVICACLFFIALGVRLLQFQDERLDFEQPEAMMNSLMRPYRQEARRIGDGEGLLFPGPAFDPANARLIVHPPAYSILVASLYADRASDPYYLGLRILQILCDSIACVLVFLIAAQLVPAGAATIAGLLAALSPHFAYYSLWLTPDVLSVLPILFAAYFVILTVKKPRLTTTIAAGIMIGLSCWLRANALLLGPLIAVAVLFLLDRHQRLKHALAVVGASLILIAPITIRNWVVYHRFVPLTVMAGLNLIEGIADYDRDGKFGMPQTDKEAVVKDVEWHNQPDYGGSLWFPDGIDRDRARFDRGVDIIRENPGWFAGVMFRRAAFMLRYNDGEKLAWPEYTSQVPLVRANPPFGGGLEVADGTPPDWQASGDELIVTGRAVSPRAMVSLDTAGPTLEVSGDGSEFGDQFSTAALPVSRESDYLLILTSSLDRGPMAARVTTADRRITLGSADLPDPLDKRVQDHRQAEGEQVRERVRVPFATGSQNEICVVLSNNGGDSPTFARMYGAELFRIGPTPHLWTRFPRALVRGLQKNIFQTGRLLPVIGVGVLLLAFAQRWRGLTLLLAVPVYYLVAQSTFHTEYRYILAIHYFLFVFAGTALFGAAVVIGTATKALRRKAAPGTVVSCQ